MAPSGEERGGEDVGLSVSFETAQSGTVSFGMDAFVLLSSDNDQEREEQRDGDEQSGGEERGGGEDAMVENQEWDARSQGTTCTNASACTGVSVAARRCPLRLTKESNKAQGASGVN